jgi:hypothetical protein
MRNVCSATSTEELWRSGTRKQPLKSPLSDCWKKFIPLPHKEFEESTCVTMGALSVRELGAAPAVLAQVPNNSAAAITSAVCFVRELFSNVEENDTVTSLWIRIAVSVGATPTRYRVQRHSPR